MLQLVRPALINPQLIFASIWQRRRVNCLYDLIKKPVGAQSIINIGGCGQKLTRIEGAGEARMCVVVNLMICKLVQG